MDLTFFGLKRRPFSPVPDPACCVAVESCATAKTTLRQCLELGRGIAVLTAPAGLGKTLLCARLAEELRDRFAVVFLTTPTFASPRALLQTLVSELGQRHLRLEEQELRLRLQSATRQLRPNRAGLVVIADEAHLLPARVLEELRALTNLIQDGEPLVRLLFSGQLELEEKLALPALSALAQRIGAHLNLIPLSRQESEKYVAERIAWAGGRLADVFSPDAVRLIVQASDGVPRALNQLCEQSLLMAATKRERPVREASVREALQELRQLPLHWNIPAGADEEHDGGSAKPIASREEIVDSELAEAMEDSPAAVEFGAVEIGFETESPAEDHRQSQSSAEVDRDDLVRPHQNGARRTVHDDTRGCSRASSCGCVQSIEATGADQPIIDRHAQLDAGRSTMGPTTVPQRPPVGRDGILPELIELRREEARITALEYCALPAPQKARQLGASVVDCREADCHEPQADRAIDRIVPLIDSSLREEWAEIPDDGREMLETDEDLEAHIGSSVVDTCMAAQREINARLTRVPSVPADSEPNLPPERRAKVRRVEPPAVPDESEEATERFRPHVGNNGWSDESAARGIRRIPRRRFERLFSEIRRRSRET